MHIVFFDVHGLLVDHTDTDPATVDRVQQLVLEDRRVMLEYVSDSVGILS